MIPTEIQPISKRQRIPFRIEFGVNAANPLSTIQTLAGDLVTPDNAIITNVALFYTVTVIISASQNFIEQSYDGTNWLNIFTLATPIGVTKANSSAVSYARYWRLRKADAVGTITQAILILALQA